MLRFSDWLHSVYYAYLHYLDNGGQRFRLPPEEPHDPAKSEGKIHPSSLTKCPLANAKRRTNEPVVIEQTREEHLRTLHVMQQGVRDAEVIQEAVLWHASTRHDVAAHAELSIEDDYLRGRMDLVVWLGEECHVVEIKRRDGNPAKPKLSDAMQVLAYQVITPPTLSLHILLLNRWSNNPELDPPGFQVWDFRLVEDGYVLVDEQDTAFDADWNLPDTLNLDQVWAYTTIQLSYLSGELSHAPYLDWLNDGKGECFTWEGGWSAAPKKYAKRYKGKTERHEYAVPRCPWFCHYPLGDRDDPGILCRETEYKSQVYEPVEAVPTPF